MVAVYVSCSWEFSSYLCELPLSDSGHLTRAAAAASPPERCGGSGQESGHVVKPANGGRAALPLPARLSQASTPGLVKETPIKYRFTQQETK